MAIVFECHLRHSVFRKDQLIERPVCALAFPESRSEPEVLAKSRSEPEELTKVGQNQKYS